MYDVIVLGAGPAGLAAAAVTLRYQLSTLVIAPDLAGKAAYRLKLPWLTETETIVGEYTVERLRQQLISAPQLTRFHDIVEQVFLHNHAFHTITAEGGAFEARALIVATGVLPRPLGVLGEQRLMGYGLSYSATSHAHLFAGRRVVVMGGDLRALRAAADLSTIADHVTLIVPDQFRLSSYMLGQRLLEAGRVTLLADYVVEEITGETAATGLVVVAPDGTRQHISTDGIFIEHGLVAQSGFLGSLVERTSSGQIVVDERGATGCAGLFAAGDITSSAYAEQILISLGEGTRAGLSARAYVLEQAIGGQEALDERTLPEG
jgi:thioredoxin reductase